MPIHKIYKGFGIFCLISLFAQQESQHIRALASLKKRILQAIFEDLRMMLLSRWWNRMWVFQEVSYLLFNFSIGLRRSRYILVYLAGCVLTFNS